MRIKPSDSARQLGQEGLQTTRLMLYLLLAVILMALDQRGHFIPRARALLGYAVEPIHHLVELPVMALRTVRTYTRSYQALEEKNRTQNQALMEQSGQVQRFAALLEENRRLRALLDASEGREDRFQFAEMVQVNLDPFSHRVMVDRGAEEGVFVGQPVIDGSGVMGQVESVYPHHSQVRLISDPDHALPVQMLRTGQRTVAFGSGDPERLLLPNLSIQSDVRPGDVLVTSGLGDRFPPGFPVAEVMSVNRDTGNAFANVEARPLAALDRGREVLLIRPAGPDVSQEGVEQ